MSGDALIQKSHAVPCEFKPAKMNVVVWFRILLASLKMNGPLQLFFYLSNLDASRFIEYSMATKFFEMRRNGVILDLGAGYSVFPKIIQGEVLNYNCEYVTLDLSVNACKFQAEEKQRNTHQIRCDISHLPIKSSSIQSVIAISSIEHVPNDALVFKEVARVLRNEGKTVISVPYSRKGIRIINVKRNNRLLFLLHKFRGLWSLLLNKHVHYFIEQTATDTLMKYYDDAAIVDLTFENQLTYVEAYHYGGGAFNKFFRYVPMGWFVLKDLFAGLILLKISNMISKRGDDKANGLVFSAKKTGT